MIHPRPPVVVPDNLAVPLLLFDKEKRSVTGYRLLSESST